MNASETVVQSYEYDERGNQLPGSGAGSVDSAKTYWGGLSVNDDTADTGLYLAGHRFFDPGLGRFLNRDHIGFRGGLNLYELAGSNPVTFTGPTGLVPGRDAGEMVIPWRDQPTPERYTEGYMTAASTALGLAAALSIATEAAAGAAFFHAVRTVAPLPAWVEAYYFGSGTAAAGANSTAAAQASRRPCPPNGAAQTAVSSIAPRLQEYVRKYPNANFAGVYDRSTGSITIRPSMNLRGQQALPGFVQRDGGHLHVSNMAGGDKANHLGFAIIRRTSGPHQVTWKSTQLNSAFPDDTVPRNLRPAILRAITEATGLSVR